MIFYWVRDGRKVTLYPQVGILCSLWDFSSVTKVNSYLINREEIAICIEAVIESILMLGIKNIIAEPIPVKITKIAKKESA